MKQNLKFFKPEVQICPLKTRKESILAPISSLSILRQTFSPTRWMSKVGQLRGESSGRDDSDTELISEILPRPLQQGLQKTLKKDFEHLDLALSALANFPSSLSS